MLTFTNPYPSDPNLAQNQDRLTPNVWITRGEIQGLYNAKTETGFTHFLSPANTEWADGNLADYATRSYTNWNTWVKTKHSGPSSVLGLPVVVHLISDDIYLGATFTSWGISHGGFSWVRSTPGTLAPTAPRISDATRLSNGSLQLGFTNAPGYTFTVLSTTNISLSQSNWTVAGTVTNAAPGTNFYQFTDSSAAGAVAKCYLIRWP
jgi:hypothetical protein